MKITISLAAISALSLATATAATYHVDSWTSAGGAFTAASQPDFSSGEAGPPPVIGTGGTLYSDTDIANGTDTGPTIAVTNVGTGGLHTGGYYYSGNSTPSFVATLTTLSSDLETVRIDVFGGGSQINPGTATTLPSFFNLNYGGQTFGTGDFKIGATETVDGHTGTHYSWTYDVSSASANAGDTFTVEWAFTAPHNAIVNFSVTQVPEPSSSLLMGVGAACLLLRRRL